MKKIVFTFIITSLVWLNIIEYTHKIVEYHLLYEQREYSPSSVCDAIVSNFRTVASPEATGYLKEVYKILTIPAKKYYEKSRG